MLKRKRNTGTSKDE